MAASTIVTIRPGVQFTPEAAASFRRAEADLERQIDVNRTYASYETQLRMYNAWLAYIQGRGPHPGHSRALHPDLSMHCRGLALDSDDWTEPGFNTFMAERGWIRTAAGDPTEQHHYEYQLWRDQHRNRPASTPESEPLPSPEAPELKDITMRMIFDTQNRDDETRRACVGEDSFEVQGPDAFARERRLWADPLPVVNVTHAEWIGILASVNKRRAQKKLHPLKGVRGEV